jgi:uncharacterized membrane protein
MAPAKMQWTAEMYQRVERGLSLIFKGFLIALVLTAMIGLNDLSYLGDDFWVSLFAFITLLMATIGINRVRAVFRELGGEAVAKPSPSATFSQKAMQPSATIRTTPAADPIAEKSRQQLEYLRSLKKQPAKKTEPAIKIDWEQWVGQKLLQKVGVLIVLVGMLVFLKYSFDNRWVDEMGRLVLSIVAAGALLIAGEYFHGKYGKWSQAFTGGGIALLYLTIWIAHVFYAEPLAVNYGLVVPAGMAFILYSVITLIGALASVRYKAQTIAWFTVLGGYLTPFLVDSPSPNVTALLLYLAVLAGGIILLAWHQKWRYLNLAAFLLTQFYLFTAVYVTVPELGDVQQVVAASGFFLLFNVLPLLYQFRQKLKADLQDIFLIVANGAAVFLPVVDALGGWESGYVGLVCFALAAFYLLFSSMALRERGDDETLVNTYLVGTLGLIAAGLFAELETEWVAAGWAPLSLLTAYIVSRIPRKGAWVCAAILLAGSLFFLAVNIPALTEEAEAIWHPFTSNWAIQSYIVFASILGWIAVTKRLPEKIQNAEGAAGIRTILNIALAAILFLAVTFEATQLDFTIDLTWTAAYIALGLIAIAVFFFSESIVWFFAAIVAQLSALLFIYFSEDASGMAVFGSSAVTPFLHPWGYLSMFALIGSVVMIYVSQLKQNAFISGIRANVLLVGLALAQVWVHVSVEIMHIRDTYDIPYLVGDRMLSGWWILFALAALAYGLLKNRKALDLPVIFLFAIPFAHNHIAILNGSDRLPETMLWTILALAISIAGARMQWSRLLKAGIIFLIAAMGIDMVAHLGDSTAGLLRSSWWALAGLITMIAGFMEREKMLRQVAMLIFGATALKLLFVDFSGLATPVRIGASIVTGLLMIGASYLYQRFDTANKAAPIPVKK